MTTVSATLNERREQAAQAEVEAVVGKLAISLATIVSAICSIVLSPIFKAYVLWFGWRWFVVPLGVPLLPPAHLIGLSMLAHYGITGLRVPSETKPVNVARELIATFLVPALMLGLLYIAKVVAFGW